MKKYATMFVLIMLLIKTNAQAQSFYYYKGDKIPLTQSNDQILIRMQNPGDANAKNRLLDKEKADGNFKFSKQLYYTENREYYMLSRADGATININDEINYYRNEPYINSVTPIYYTARGSIVGISNEVIVKFKGDGTLSQLQNLTSKFSTSSVVQDKYNEKLFHIFLSKISPLDALQVSSQLYEDGEFEIAVPNLFGQLHIAAGSACSTPALNDPLFPISTLVPFGEWELDNINVCTAWNFLKADHTKTNVNVAIVDVGVDASHEDLVGRVLSGADLETASTNPRVDVASNVVDAHGTMIAGIIASNNDNGTDIAGATTTPGSEIPGGVYIYPVRAFLENINCDNCAVDFDDKNISTGITIASKNADVLSLSFVLADDGSSCPLTEVALQNAFFNGREGKGCAIFAAAGNDGIHGIPFPANDHHVLCITGSDENSNFINHFPVTGGSNYGPEAAVAAPGIKINTLIPMGSLSGITTIMPVPSYPNVGFNMAGTSFSVPYVAAEAALLLQINPCLTAQEVYDLIKITADKVGTDPYVNGFNEKMGYGRINIGNAAILAHDMYRQGESFTFSSGFIPFNSVHNLYAGSNVTSLKPTGYEVVNANSVITFEAAQGVTLKPGFEADYGSIFEALIQAPCAFSDYHWRPAPDDSTGADSTLSVQSVNSADAFSTNIYPNPTQGVSYLTYQLPASAIVAIHLYNSIGQDMSDLIQTYERSPVAGNYKVAINSDRLSPGLYYCTLSVSGTMVTKKLVVY